jgi:hypothetical protein
MKLLFLSFIFLFGTHGKAEDFPSTSVTEDEFTRGFDTSKGMKESDKDEVSADRLKIGGSLQAEWQDYTTQSTDYLFSPMTLELYLDSTLKNDIRAFFRGRFIHDPSIDESIPSPLTGLSQKQDSSVIDEMNLRFHSNRKIFWTIGAQKLKWGASKFWNPTDFINLQRRDLLRQEDLRKGISMVKAHVPINDSNLYLIAVNENSAATKQVGAAVKYELPFSSGEWSLSGYSRLGLSTKIGTDLSMAIGDTDVYIEAAQSDTGRDKSISGGISYEVKYSDDDNVAFGLEGFWQENGTENKATYATSLAAGTFIPFYVGKKYELFSVTLLKPGSWNYSNILFYVIQNSSDQSQYYRLTWIYNGMSDATWTAAIGARSGASDTEMKFLGQNLDGLLQVRLVF